MTTETHLPRAQLLINLERAGAAMADAMKDLPDIMVCATLQRAWDRAFSELQAAPALALAGDAQPVALDTDRLKALVREYGNRPVIRSADGGGRICADVFDDIVDLIACAAPPLPVVQPDYQAQLAEALNMKPSAVPLSWEALLWAVHALVENFSAPLPVAQDASPYGWQQHIDGVKTQNFARDEKELADIKSVFRLMKHPGKDTYLPLFTRAAAVPVVAQDASCINLNDVNMEVFYETYLEAFGPQDPNITQNDINFHIREIIKAAAVPVVTQDARAEAAKLSPILRAMCEGGGAERAADIYSDDYFHADGDVFVIRASELLTEFSAPSVAVAQDAPCLCVAFKRDDCPYCGPYSERATINDVIAAAQLHAPSLPAVAPQEQSVPTNDCRMQGGICSCRSGGSYGGCRKERDGCCAVFALAAPQQPEAEPTGAETMGCPELCKAFITLESNGGEGRTIVLKFNQRNDAYAVHHFLMKGGIPDRVQLVASELSDEQIDEVAAENSWHLALAGDAGRRVYARAILAAARSAK